MLQKLKTELKNIKYRSHTINLSEGTIFAKKWWCFAKNADFSRIKRALVLKGILSENTSVCVLKYKVSILAKF